MDVAGQQNLDVVVAAHRPNKIGIVAQTLHHFTLKLTTVPVATFGVVPGRIPSVTAAPGFSSWVAIFRAS